MCSQFPTNQYELELEEHFGISLLPINHKKAWDEMECCILVVSLLLTKFIFFIFLCAWKIGTGIIFHDNKKCEGIEV